jgi:3-oxoacyl-[acyl-carrier protein] reductase
MSSRPDLSGKVAFVTGGAGGIGSEIVRALAAHGASVAICYASRPDEAERLAKEVEAPNVQSEVIALDQRNPDSITAAVAQCERKFGRLDILVNNAAWNIGIPFPDTDALDADVWDQMMEINLRGPYLIAREAARLLKHSSSGKIINISSNGGIAPTSSSIAYSVSKAGLLHLTRCLAVALAPNVAVNAIAPGVVEGTRMAERMPPEIREAESRSAVLGRVASAADIAHLIVCICQSNSISGQTFVIDGGMPIAMR